MSYILRSILTLLTFSVVFISQAQTLETVLPIIKASHDSTWYKTQRDLWYKEIKKDRKNENAWLNYAFANRYYMTTSGKYSWGQTSAELNAMMDEMQKSIPKSFTYNLMKARSLGSWDPAGAAFADEAYRLRPNDPMALREIIVRYELFGSREKRIEANIRYFNSNDPSSAMTNYNYNVLASLKPNAILFTCGDNDTYPLWMIQDVMGYRTDVIIINISLAGIDEYRDRLMKQAGITFTKEEADLLHMGEEGGDIERAEMEKNIITMMAKHTDRPIYVGLTAFSDNLTKDIENNLYVTGLASLYSTERIDNIALLKKNFEKDFLLDYLIVNFRVDEWARMTQYCNQNYLNPAVTLYKHYILSGETEKAAQLKIIIIKIAKENGIENDVLLELNKV
jgi:hypothetical protein